MNQHFKMIDRKKYSAVLNLLKEKIQNTDEIIDLTDKICDLFDEDLTTFKKSENALFSQFDNIPPIPESNAVKNPQVLNKKPGTRVAGGIIGSNGKFVPINHEVTSFDKED